MYRTVTIAATVAALAITAAPATAAASTASSTPRCTAGRLHVTVDPRHVPGNGTAGSDGRVRHAVLVDFENTSAHTCTLFGYPGAAILGYTGTQVRQARRTTGGNYGGHVARTVTLRPRHYAAAYLEGERSTRPGNCGEHYPALLVTPPNTSRSTRLAVQWPKCFSFDVHPVRALTSRP